MNVFGDTNNRHQRVELTWDHTICLKCGGEKNEHENLCESCRHQLKNREVN